MRRFLLKLTRRRRLERELQAEIAFHREMASSAGNPVPFGNQTAIVEEARELWRFTFLEDLWRDVVYGARGLAHRPALFVGAVLSLALGLGANTTVFSLGTELLLSEPSVVDAGSLVYVRDGGNSHTSPEKLDVVRRSGLFADVAGEHEESVVNWNDGQETHRIFAMVTTKNFFATVGTPLAIGRGIQVTDPDDVAVLAHHFWSLHYNRDPSILGRAITLDGRPFTVVGVLTASNRTLVGYGFAPDVYVPPSSPTEVLAMYARLEPGTSVEATRAAVRALGSSVDADSPASAIKFRNLTLSAVAGLRRLQDDPMAMTVTGFFAAVLAVMVLVLVLACVNVAGLLLAQGAARRRELAIRVALGAGRRRLFQQLLVESLLLSLLGAAVGVILARWLAAQVSAMALPLPLPVMLRADVDWRVLTYATLLAVVATLTSGVLPALQSVRESVAPHLHRERRLYLRRVLVVGQVAVSFVVLVAALLFVRNLVATRSVDPGFDMAHTVRVTASLSQPASVSDEAARSYVAASLEVLRSLPGVEAAGAARSLPFNDRSSRGLSLRWENTSETISVSYLWNAVSEDYFRAIGIPVRAGRSFVAADDHGPRVVVVNRSFVDRYLAGRSPIGAAFVVDERGPHTYRIVGVVDFARTFTLGEDERPQLYELLTQIQSGKRDVNFVIRAAGDPAGLVKPVQTALRAIDAGAGLEVTTLRDSMALAFLPSQVGAVFMSAAGGLGLLLVAVGLFGTMAYSVTERAREVGVRLALGATPAQVSAIVFADCGRLLIVGLGLGVAIAVLVTQPLGAFLVPGLSPVDPWSFTLVLTVMALTGTAATWLPARRAASIDPAVSLRSE